MKKCLINNDSDNLLIFFTGWGCDEFEFEHLQSTSDVLLLYDYSDLNLDFDFSKYKRFDLISFSAGVFVGSVMDFDFEIESKTAISGNPYLFDEKLGLSKKVQDLLYNVNEENAEEFAKNYLVKTDEEWKNFYPSRRTIDSCKLEFDKLRELYHNNKQNIKNIYNSAIIGDEDPFFNVDSQKEFYNNILIIKNAKHNLFFRIKNYNQLMQIANL